MDIFYKYTIFHGIESLINPAVRISPAKILNDPFECRFNEEVKKSIREKMSLRGLGFDVNPDFPKESEGSHLMFLIDKEVDNYGIFSLSETPRNMLMWAHYSNEHTGICIGYKKDIFDSIPDKIEDYISIAARYTPVKVNYDNIRPQVINKSSSELEKIQAYTYQQLTTKSDDWMYEKEHRCIIPIHWSDEVKIIDDSDADLDMKQTGIIRDLINEGRIKKNKNGNYDGELLSVIISFYKTYKGAVFLKNINKGSIDSIYLGCRFNQRDANKIISLVSKEGNGLSHIKIFQCIPSPNRFEIIPYQIYPAVENQ